VAAPAPGTDAISFWQRNLVKRVVAGVPALVVVLALIAVAPPGLLALLVAAAGVWGTREYVGLLAGGSGAVLPLPAMLIGAGLVGLGGLLGSAGSLGGGLFVAVLVVLWGVWLRAAGSGPEGLRLAGLGLTGLLLVPWLFNHAGLLAYLPEGRGFLALLVAAVTLNDSLAYAVGTLLGRHPLLPAVSPHKTVEGALGGLAGGVIAALLARLWLPDAFTLAGLVGLGVLTAAAGQAGDLMESKLKRLNRAKESGRFLPGHGGLLDRLDAYLLAAPLLYYLLTLLAG
jgi:phosphatidate cytidylyltransferase